MQVVVKLKNHANLFIDVHETETGKLWFDLSKHINQTQTPFYQDTLFYTNQKMIELAHQAKEAFGWNWLSDSYDISLTTQLHKDLELSVGKLSFKNIPEEYDQLLYDLHHCLHAIQFGKTCSGRFDNFQIEWFTDQSIPLPASFEFQESCNFGDLILINPYVGHNPLQIYCENDFSSLDTTCKFHDIIKPGIVLTNGSQITKDQILEAFKQNDSKFVQQQGEDKIRYYSGSAVIGQVIDIDLFLQIKQCETPLVLECVEFYE
jgi:hypothetical protein